MSNTGNQAWSKVDMRQGKKHFEHVQAVLAKKLTQKRSFSSTLFTKFEYLTRFPPA